MEENYQNYRPSADLLINALDMTDSGVAIIDPEGEDRPIIYVNDGFLKMTGYHKKEIIGKNSRLLHGMDTPAQAISEIDQAIANKQSISLEIINYKKNGDKFWSDLRLNPVYVESENRYYYVAFQRDITDQKYKDEKLKAIDVELQLLSTPIVPIVDHVFALPIVGIVNEERLQHIFDDVTEAVYSSNIETLILDLSGLHNLSEEIIKGLFTLHELLELLGSELIITGISEELADKTKMIDLDLNDFQTFATIKEAITYKQSTEKIE
ncbi:PAS domain-containing protein [Alteribacillus iranensis]|uniref:PAS domain S-box-containing protein n=1 Tax=Alteribacillus iranensis TaxID=930128 RepID=A0A1I2E0D2_9BACI|nr:STAS domain-containing protein [Alteribacillus iranensis]SFE86038.1 PAS domain S-box-containing protein [Alteribacillus iranensis]